MSIDVAREPKGTPVGGRFAAQHRPAADASVTLTEPTEVDTVTFITSEHVDRFTHRDCHVLAAAISRRTGWPLAAVVQKDEDFQLTDDCGWSHAVVEMPDGRYLDATGVNDHYTLLDQYAEILDMDAYDRGEDDYDGDRVQVDRVSAKLLGVADLEPDAEAEAVAERLLDDLRAHEAMADFSKDAGHDVYIWSNYPHLSPRDDARTDEMACVQMSERFVEVAKVRGLEAETVAFDGGGLTGEHVWAKVDGVNVDWTARQFYNLEFPANPAHQDLPCPLVWRGEGHPVLDPR